MNHTQDIPYWNYIGKQRRARKKCSSAFFMNVFARSYYRGYYLGLELKKLLNSIFPRFYFHLLLLSKLGSLWLNTENKFGGKLFMVCAGADPGFSIGGEFWFLKWTTAKGWSNYRGPGVISQVYSNLRPAKHLHVYITDNNLITKSEDINSQKRGVKSHPIHPPPPLDPPLLCRYVWQSKSKSP
jgi:hypothetical protein